MSSKYCPSIFPLLLFFILSTLGVANAQNSSSYWSALGDRPTFAGKQYITPKEYKAYALNIADLKQQLASAPLRSSVAVGQSQTVITIPMADGRQVEFRVAEAPVMEGGLAQKFPQMRTYVVQGVENTAYHGRIDITQRGFHAMLWTPEGQVFVDPFSLETDEYYMSYYKSDFQSSVIDEFVELGLEGVPGGKEIPAQARMATSGDELRTYRLACATTAEYTSFHGGTVAGALAAVVTTVNRVVGVYELEVAVSLTLVSNNNLLIFTNASTDGYTNSSGGAMLSQNQSIVDNTIGTANYDIGHVFSTGGGGIASLGSVCSSSSKARGVTGRFAPVGDPFDIDYVAHEMGHQFGARHTFNGTSGSCAGGNRNGATAYEPGSGTTIMAYAGICAPQNIQSNSDAYFHFNSYDEIVQFTTAGGGNTCAVVTSTGNLPPTANAGPSTYTIPHLTPFVLDGSGSDPDGSSLTYGWEEADLGPGGAPASATGNAPIFRSFPPSTSSSRTFPQLQTILFNSNVSVGERLPNNDRTMEFRLTVRDNNPSAGGVDFDTRTVPVVTSAGPFLVTSPNTNVNWGVNTMQTVTWDVANTDKLPVNCQQVNIKMSTDGGYTYPITLATNTPNDGAHAFLMPNNPSNVARIKVEAADNIFFDVGNTFFTVSPISSPQFSLMADSLFKSQCLPGQVQFNISTAPLGGFSDTVTLSVAGLPAGAVASFSLNDKVPPFNSILTVSNLGLSNAGLHSISLIGTSVSNTQNRTLELNLYASPPPAPTLLEPVNQDGDVTLSPVFSWNSVPEADSYIFELSTDPAFNTIVIADSAIADTTFSYTALLPEGTVYYWRVRGLNVCGEGTNAPFFTFRTLIRSCTTYSSSDLPKTISSSTPSTTLSVVPVSDVGTISDVRVTQLMGTHTWINDLVVRLTSPANTAVTLFNRICNDENNFNVKFDDAALSSTLPCPPTDGGYYQPEGQLSDFSGEQSSGNWFLSVQDVVSQDGGFLLSFSFEICFAANNSNAAPTIAQNNTLFLNNLGTSVIDNTLLLVNDADNTADVIRYDLVSLPANGQLLLSGTALVPGDSFTQQDIDNGLISYVHTATGTSADSFDFTVNDGAGGFIGTSTFNISIGVTGIGESVLSASGLKVWPNPADGIFYLQMSEDRRYGRLVVQVVDNLGRVLLEKDVHEGQTELDLRHLASGIYYLKAIDDSTIGVERLIKR